MATHKLQKLNYRVLYCTGEDPIYPVSELFYNSPQCKGWCSSKFCEFPQEIILQFTHLVRLREVQILTHQSKIPTRLEMHTFLPSGLQAVQGELPLNKIKFEKLGYMEFDTNEKTKFQTRELKSAYVDSMAMLLKLFVYDNHQNKVNIFNQVSIIAINCLGEYYIPPTAELREPLPMGGRFEEEMQYDPSTIEKLKQLFEAKKIAVAEADYERAQKINLAIERLKSIGIKLNELVERKRQALAKNDFNLAKKFKDEIDNLRMSVLNSRLHFEETQQQQQAMRQKSGKQLQRIVESRSNMGFERVPLTTEIELREKKDYITPQLDRDRVIMGNDLQMMQQQYNEKKPKKIDRSFQNKVSNQEPITVEELIKKQQPSQFQKGFDDQVVPALNGNPNRGLHEVEIEQPPEDIFVKIQEAGELSEDDQKKADPLIPVFGNDLVKKIFAGDWHLREQGINQIAEEASLGTKSNICGQIDQERLFTACFGVIANTVHDKISQVCTSSLNFILKTCKEIFPTVTLHVKSDLNRYVDTTCLWILDKIGESNVRIREKCEEAALAMAGHPAIGSSLLVNHITKGQVKKSAANSFRHIAGRLNLLRKIIQTQKIKENNLNSEACVEYAIEQLQNSNGDVRAAAYGILLETYSQIGGVIKNEFINLRPIQLDLIERSFALVDQGDMEGAYKVISSGGGNSQGVSKQSTTIKKSLPNSEVQTKTVNSSQVSKTNNSPQNSSPKHQQSVKSSQKIKAEVAEMPTCQFCKVANEEYDRDEVLDLHFWKDCKYLTQCMHCEQVIEIPMLSTHWMTECEKSEVMRQCKTCKEVMHENEFEQHTIDKKCPKNPKGDPKCPLCKTPIPKIGGKFDQGWQQHLMQDGCSKNPRN